MSAIHTLTVFETDDGQQFVGGTYTNIPCGCKVVGGGTLQQPLAIEFCAMHQTAPDLLAALRECITEEGAACWRSREYAEKRIRYIDQTARAAIAKAEPAA